MRNRADRRGVPRVARLPMFLLAILLVIAGSGCKTLAREVGEAAASEGITRGVDALQNDPSPSTFVATPKAAKKFASTATATPGAAVTVTVAAAPPDVPELAVERTVVVANTGGDGVNLREPKNGEPIWKYPEGTRLTVRGPAEEMDGRFWLPVRGPDGQEGWVAQEYTESVDSLSPTPVDAARQPSTIAADVAMDTNPPAELASAALEATPEPQPALPTEAAETAETVVQPFVVAIDPGHGGPEVGAANATYGIAEKHVNLDIGLRLAALLEANGYQVVMTRTTDSAVNVNGEDLNGSGAITVDDDLQARVDVANAAGADVFISIHNNGGPSSMRGTAVYYCADHPQGARAAHLADLLQQSFLTHLAAIGHDPIDTGASDDANLGKPYGHLFVVGVQTPRIARELAMPGVLGESLFVSNNLEASLLARDDVLQELALAYYDAITSFLAEPPPDEALPEEALPDA